MRWKKTRRVYEIAPEEIFLDSSNLPEYEAGQFEGRVARPVATRSIFTVGVVFIIVVALFAYRAFNLQISRGSTYASISDNNTLKHSILFATRGVLYDRTGRELAWNEAQLSAATTTSSYALRKYSALPGLSHLIGFIQYPKSDAKGTWWREEYSGVSGLELSLNNLLLGQNGSTMMETDAHNHLQRENIVSPPVGGENIILSIDADVQSTLFSVLSKHARDMHFGGGAAVIMNVQPGEFVALSSVPE